MKYSGLILLIVMTGCSIKADENQNGLSSALRIADSLNNKTPYSCTEDFGEIEDEIKKLKPGDLFIKDKDAEKEKKNLSRSDVLKDLALLIYSLENAYGGRKYLPGTLFNDVIIDLKKLSNLNIKTSKVLCEKISKILLKIPDKHMLATYSGDICLEEIKRKFVKGSVGKNINRNPKKPWSLNYKLINGKNIPILSISNMVVPHDDKSWNGFKEKVLEIKKKSPALIIDLRGNGGGDSTNGMLLAGCLYGTNPPIYEKRRVFSLRPGTFAILANVMKGTIRKMNKEKIPASKAIKKYYDDYMMQYEKALKGEMPKEKVATYKEKVFKENINTYKKPIYILQDRECSSSCEDVVAALKGHPYVKFVGENTAGMINFENVGILRLPESGIYLQMASRYVDMRDGKMLDYIGYEPDIRVSAGKDALKVTLEELAEEKLNEK